MRFYSMRLSFSKENLLNLKDDLWKHLLSGYDIPKFSTLIDRVPFENMIDQIMLHYESLNVIAEKVVRDFQAEFERNPKSKNAGIWVFDKKIIKVTDQQREVFLAFKLHPDCQELSSEEINYVEAKINELIFPAIVLSCDTLDRHAQSQVLNCIGCALSCSKRELWAPSYSTLISKAQKVLACTLVIKRSLQGVSDKEFIINFTEEKVTASKNTEFLHDLLAHIPHVLQSSFTSNFCFASKYTQLVKKIYEKIESLSETEDAPHMDTLLNLLSVQLDGFLADNESIFASFDFIDFQGLGKGCIASINDTRKWVNYMINRWGENPWAEQDSRQVQLWNQIFSELQEEVLP